jgi:UDP-N-acetylmuramate dehydrogenase
MFAVEENKSLIAFSTMRIGGMARYFAVCQDKEEIRTVVRFAKERGVPVVVVGTGSNMIWSDTVHNIFLLQNTISGFDTIDEDDTSITVLVGAGENWDEIVARTVDLGLSGIEAMSAIPGTVGATPVQNVGAYGQEIKDTLEYVEVYDTHSDEFKKLSNDECLFRYRDSIFKTEEKGRYIITRVAMKLSKLPSMQPKYPAVVSYFQEKGITNPTLEEIRDAIVAIRASKLPDPSLVPNCGSFFENALVKTEFANMLKEKFPDVKMFPVNDAIVKIPSGWLIEACGLKGQYVGKLKLHDKNALVLTNPDGATFADLLEARQIVIDAVREKFGIVLESEPNIIYS